MTTSDPLIHAVLPLESLFRLSGFGQSEFREGYRFLPRATEDVLEAFALAKKAGFQVVLRGAGRSYGDAAIGAECLILDFADFNRVLNWDPATGVLEAEPGATIEDLWRTGLPDGWWPMVVSGTMFPTLGGALAMNIHGKNAFKVGTIGEHVLEIDVAFPNGEVKALTPKEDLFYAVISGAGLLGAIVRVKIQLKKVQSGLLDVYAESCPDWPDQFRLFEEWQPKSDYMVSWVNAFGGGQGLFHAATHVHENDPASLAPGNQDLPAKIMGLVPKSQVWRILKLLNGRMGMKTLNGVKHLGGKLVGNKASHRQSLVAFSFLLDYVPDWQKAYLPHGFIQYQSFVPKAHAQEVFAEQVKIQRAERRENYLAVLKRHKPDRFLFSHAVDGYSMAMDFKIAGGRWKDLERMCWRMNDIVLQAGGRFYFAKDSTLRRSDVEAYLGSETLATFRELKAKWDPDNLLTSGLAKRVGLDPRA